ncbi:LacI family transcriptional regulator [Ornithinimicrobium sp. Arc0846-15]|nr:LacI family transcriptional regulator [Ornithinimicrobium laminariae]
MSDIARAAGVSVKTVSRVHNGEENVSPETRDRVMQAIAELGYVRNDLARAFRMGDSSVLGIVVPDIEDPFFASIVHQVDQSAAEHGMLTFVAGTGDDPEQERRRVEALMGRQLSGLLLASVSHDHGYLQRWANSTPIVFIDRRPEGIEGDSLASDDAAGAITVTQHLLDHGHHKIAFLGDSLEVSTTSARLASYREVLGAAGIEANPEYAVMSGFTPEGVTRAIDSLRALPDQPTALISSNGRANQIIAAQVSDLQLALVAFSDFPLADALSPTITALDQQPRLLAQQAVARLLERQRHTGGTALPFEAQTVPSVLVERQSCQRPIVDQPLTRH